MGNHFEMIVHKSYNAAQCMTIYRCDAYELDHGRHGSFICEYVSPSITECVKKCLTECWNVIQSTPRMWDSYASKTAESFANIIYVSIARFHIANMAGPYDDTTFRF